MAAPSPRRKCFNNLAIDLNTVLSTLYVFQNADRDQDVWRDSRHRNGPTRNLNFNQGLGCCPASRMLRKHGPTCEIGTPPANPLDRKDHFKEPSRMKVREHPGVRDSLELPRAVFL